MHKCTVYVGIFVEIRCQKSIKVPPLCSDLMPVAHNRIYISTQIIMHLQVYFSGHLRKSARRPYGKALPYFAQKSERTLR
jgi:hypothetical protein